MLVRPASTRASCSHFLHHQPGSFSYRPMPVRPARFCLFLCLSSTLPCPGHEGLCE
ncbi:hypothetical protein V8C43DRAFT_274796 [Trichoderma afarasin]